MPFIIADRVRESSTTVGTGSIALAGAVTGYQTFDAVLDTTDTTFYTIADQGGANWEVGIGTFTAPSTLARTTILSSSNGGSIVNFGAGTKDVFISLPASRTNVNDQPNVISVNSTSNALRITQTGTGNALVVEDSANPDSTPFVVDSIGRVGIGVTAPETGLQLNGQFTLDRNDTTSTTQSQQINQRRKRQSDAILANGDRISSLFSSGWDGASYVLATAIHGEVDGTPGTNDMPGRLVFSTTADGASSPTERMRINNAGQVGIGVASLTNQRLRVQYNLSDTASTANNVFLDGTHTLTANNAFTYTSMDGQAALNQGGFNATVSLASGGAVRGQRAFTTVTGASGTVTAASGMVADVRNTGAGVLTNAAGFVSIAHANSGGGTLTNAMGFYSAAQTAGTNNFGFYSDVAVGVGRWNFYANGTADNYFAGQVQLAAGSVGTPALAAFGDTNTGIFFPAADTMAFVEGGTEAARIDSSANLLVNTTTAVSRLTVNGDVAGTFFVNPTTVSANYTIPTNYNAMTAGPITVNSGITVTVPSGSVWTVT